MDTRVIEMYGKYAKGECAVTLVDSDIADLLEVSGYRCYFKYKRIRKADGRTIGYATYEVQEEGKRRYRSLHHLVLGITELPTGMVVDHLNGDTLDNRRSNLRLLDLAQNARNRLTPRGLANYRGIRVIKGRYVPVIKYRGQRLYFWRFRNPEDAARMWDFLMLLLDEKAIKRHTNFPAKKYTHQVQNFRRMMDYPGGFD